MQAFLGQLQPGLELEFRAMGITAESFNGVMHMTYETGR